MLRYKFSKKSYPIDTNFLEISASLKYGIVQLCQPTYSSDIAPNDFWLFPKLKMPLKGQQIDDVQMIETNAMTVLEVILKDEYQGSFQKWKTRSECVVVQSNGDCFEGCHKPDDVE